MKMTYSVYVSSICSLTDGVVLVQFDISCPVRLAMVQGDFICFIGDQPRYSLAEIKRDFPNAKLGYIDGLPTSLF